MNKALSCIPLPLLDKRTTTAAAAAAIARRGNGGISAISTLCRDRCTGIHALPTEGKIYTTIAVIAGDDAAGDGGRWGRGG